MSNQIVTLGRAELMQRPLQTEAMQIKDNTTSDGSIVCVKCDIAYLVKESRPILVGMGFEEPKIVDVDTYFCDVCDHSYLQDQEVTDIRKELSK